MGEDAGNLQRVYLRVTPEELVFTPDFEKPVPLTITLTNEHQTSYIAFKVRTTAPNRYLVKPGTGLVPPGKSTQVTVYLTLSKGPVPTDLRRLRDKFQILEYLLPEPPEESTEQKYDAVKRIWERTDAKENARHHKLRCSFNLPPEDTPSLMASSTTSRPTNRTASSLTGSGTEDDKIARYRAEKEKYRRDIERLMLEKAQLERQLSAGGTASFIPVIIAFIIGFILARILW